MAQRAGVKLCVHIGYVIEKCVHKRHTHIIQTCSLPKPRTVVFKPTGLLSLFTIAHKIGRFHQFNVALNTKLLHQVPTYWSSSHVDLASHCCR